MTKYKKKNQLKHITMNTLRKGKEVYFHKISLPFIPQSELLLDKEGHELMVYVKDNGIAIIRKNKNEPLPKYSGSYQMENVFNAETIKDISFMSKGIVVTDDNGKNHFSIN